MDEFTALTAQDVWAEASAERALRQLLDDCVQSFVYEAAVDVVFGLHGTECRYASRWWLVIVDADQGSWLWAM